MVAAQYQRKCATRGHLGDTRRDQLTGVVDLGQEARALVPQCGRLGNRGFDVPLVADGVTQADESLLEPGISDRRRPHVDATPPLPEVERRTDDRDLPLRAHGENLT